MCRQLRFYTQLISCLRLESELYDSSCSGTGRQKAAVYPRRICSTALILPCFTLQKGKYSFSEILWRVLSAICRYLIFKSAIFNHNIHMLLYRFGLFVSVIFFYVITYAKLEKAGFLPGDVEKNRHPLNKTGLCRVCILKSLKNNNLYN